MTEENVRASTGKKFMKYVLGGALALSVVGGTYSAHEKDFPPFYVRKTGNSGGVCVGIRVDVEKGAKFIGPVFAIYTHNSGDIYGANISIANVQNGSKINGLEIALMANAPFKDGQTLDEPSTVKGVQASILINFSKASEGLVQIGLFNQIRESNDKRKNGFLLNYSFANQYKEGKKE